MSTSFFFFFFPFKIKHGVPKNVHELCTILFRKVTKLKPYNNVEHVFGVANNDKWVQINFSTMRLVFVFVCRPESSTD